MAQSQVTEAAMSIKPPSLRTMAIGLLPSIVINGVLVFVVYQLVKHYTSASDVTALFISAIPAMVSSIVSLLRQRRVDVLGAFALVTIAASIALTFISGDARLFQIRESFLTVLFGIVCLVSLLFPKPIWFYIIWYFTTGNRPEQQTAFNAAWHHPAFRAYIRNVTIFWGLTYAIEFLVRFILIYTMPLPQFLIVSPIIFYGITIAAIAWTIRSGVRLRRRADERRSREAMEAASSSN